MRCYLVFSVSNLLSAFRSCWLRLASEDGSSHAVHSGIAKTKNGGEKPSWGKEKEVDVDVGIFRAGFNLWFEG